MTRGEKAEVLRRLKGLIASEPQLQHLLRDLEVVVPSAAPPVLRGVYLQLSRPQRGPPPPAAEREGPLLSKLLLRLRPELQVTARTAADLGVYMQAAGETARVCLGCMCRQHRRGGAP